MNRIFGALLLLLLCSSCEKDIDFDLNEVDDVLVVDAMIESGERPLVVLTKSLDFYSTVDPALLLNSFVRNAEVTMSNGTTTHKLKEFATVFPNGNVVYAYSIDSSDLATAFIGTYNTAYTLNIKAEGKEYSAKTTIPPLAKVPDSLWWKPAPFVEDTNQVILMMRITDPPGLGNYVRYFTRTNNGPFLPGENSVFDDQVIDNSTYQLEVEPGINRNMPIESDSNYFRRGDTVSFKLANIDKTTYTFWSTWEFAFQSIGNPFSQPNKVLGNISNGALGAFYGYASAVKTLVIPK